jgi:hypothetical protein
MWQRNKQKNSTNGTQHNTVLKMDVLSEGNKFSMALDREHIQQGSHDC